MLGNGKIIDHNMLRYIFLFVLLVFSKQVAAQAPDPELATRYRPGILWFYDGFKSTKLADARKYDRFIIDLVHSDWMSDNTRPFTNHPASIGFNTQFIFDFPLTRQNIISFGIGLGYGHNKIRSTQVVTNFNNTTETQLASQSLFPDLRKSIFKSNVLFVPVELRFRTPGWQHVKLHVGARFGLQMLAKTKDYLTVDGSKKVVKTKEFDDLNRWLMSVHTRIGIRNWAITASYNITPYFDTDKVNQINGLELGLSFSFF